VTGTYLQDFEAGAVAPSAVRPAWLEALRKAGIERFSAVGFPGPKDEDWRFTPIGPIARTAFAPARPAAALLDRAGLEPFLFGHPEWATLVFVNGRHAPELSTRPVLPGGAEVLPLTEALETRGDLVEAHLGRHALAETTPFAALNQAFAPDGAVVIVPAGVELAHPIHLVFVASADAGGTVTHPRNLLVVERGARAAVVESYVALGGDAAYFTNTVTEVSVGRGAWLEHARIQREHDAAYHVGYTHVDQDQDSHYRSFTLAMGARLARHNLHARLGAPHVETLLYGLALTRGEQLADNHTAIFHDHPNCNSWEVYKSVLDDQSRGVFNGKVFVTPEAQKTDAKQTNRNLLLSPDARVDTKPQLEIFADDVKCTHGATVGQIDEVAYFYLQSRGIPRERAQTMLTCAFAAEVVDEIAIQPVREHLTRLVTAQLGGDA
jgi:Fe-S cluster assembly protein SufD